MEDLHGQQAIDECLTHVIETRLMETASNDRPNHSRKMPSNQRAVQPEELHIEVSCPTPSTLASTIAATYPMNLSHHGTYMTHMMTKEVMVR
jgi:hypothetical protein